jgi:hypothetical protein
MPVLEWDTLVEQLQLSDQLLAGRDTMLEPQDLPGRFGRVVKAIDRLLQVTQCPSALAGGWAVWRHGFLGRVTQDINIVLPADRVEDFMRAAEVSGFETSLQLPGRWPKVLHKYTQIKVDILPEGGRPGTDAKPAPTVIPHPLRLGAKVGKLGYIDFGGLIELKLAAGRARDEADVVELIRANPNHLNDIRQHLQSVHADYLQAFDQLAERAKAQVDA